MLWRFGALVLGGSFRLWRFYFRYVAKPQRLKACKDAWMLWRFGVLALSGSLTLWRFLALPLRHKASKLQSLVGASRFKASKLQSLFRASRSQSLKRAQSLNCLGVWQHWRLAAPWRFGALAAAFTYASKPDCIQSLHASVKHCGTLAATWC